MTEDEVRKRAASVGFDVVRFARVGDIDDRMAVRLEKFIEAGWHGDMAWMASRAHQRGHPSRLWTDARSAVALGISYAPWISPVASQNDKRHAVISVYAQGGDYHDIVKGKLKQVAQHLGHMSGADVKVFVDTAPLMEKPIAQAAGVGWQGKHTNLVSRELGSWFFLGIILTSAELEPDSPEVDHCGSCQRCLDACPTEAFPAPYQLDARRCISYLTIEHRGPIDRTLRPRMGNRVFGCDDCLAVCPWNKFAVESRERRFAARVDTDNPPLEDLLGLDDASFRKRFAGTSIKRTGRTRFIRNVLIAAGNSGDRSLRPRVEERLDDADALVRGAAVWAMARLCAPEELASVGRRHAQREAHETVKAEWSAEGIR